jgi:ATP-dependent Lon protease
MPIKLNKTEEAFYKKQSASKKKDLLDLMTRVSSLVLDEGEVPYKFQVLQLPISDYVKSSVIKKITTLNEICSDGGDSHKIRSWVDAFMRVPFGKTVPLPVKLSDGVQKCTEFMMNARKKMDQHIYGMNSAKLQIMQIIAQWIVNPNSVGNVIALQGPMGVGKTSFAKNAIAEVLERPFEFFTLGGASDIANFIGHSYTYEGSMWGRIVDSIMHAKHMNPVMYFDELDKISGTVQGEEITSMMIHMTDRSQNTQFHDRYFAGVDFDLSQCLFVFSFNDIDKVHPILRDRMSVIHCGGYNEKDKSVILKDYIWPQILERLAFKKDDVILSESAINFMIEEYSKEEKGVRTLIRSVESMMTRINMLRVAKHDSMKDYKFYMDVELPLTITDSVVKHVLVDLVKKDAETWRSMYC